MNTKSSIGHWLFSIFSIIVIFGFHIPSHAQTLQLYPIQDTHLQDEVNVDVTLGGSSNLFVGTYNQNDKECRTLMQFDTSGITGRVIRATLHMFRFYKYKDQALFADVYRLTRPWNEDEINWANSDGGAFHAPDPVATTLLPGIGAGDVYNKAWERWDNVWYQWDLTDIVQQWVDGSTDNFGILMKTDDLYGSMSGFRSSNASENRPWLEIELEEDATVQPTATHLQLEIDGLNITLTWNEIPGVQNYTLFYAPYPEAEIVGQVDMGNQTTFSAALWEGAALYVAIAYIDENGREIFSNIESFQLNDDDTPPSYNDLCMTPVQSFGEAFSNLTLIASVEHDIFADLLLIFSENGTKALFDPTASLGEDDPALLETNYDRVARAGALYHELSGCFESTMTFLENNETESTQRGIVKSTYDFFVDFMGGNGDRAGDRIKTIIEQGGDTVQSEVYETAKDLWPDADLGDSPEEFMGKLDDGELNDKAHFLHSTLCNDPETNYSEIAVDTNERPMDVVVEEGVKGIKSGTDFYVDSTKVIIGSLPNGEKFGQGFDKAKNTVDKISAYDKDGVSGYVKKGAQIDIENDLKTYLDEKGISNDLYDAIKDSTGIMAKYITDYFKHTTKSQSSDTNGGGDVSEWDWGTLSFDETTLPDDISEIMISWENEEGDIETLLAIIEKASEETDDPTIPVPAEGGDKEITSSDEKGNPTTTTDVTVTPGETTVVSLPVAPLSCVEGEKVADGVCIPMTCRDDGYGCPTCNENEVLEYLDDGSGICVEEPMTGSVCPIEKSDTDPESFWLYPDESTKIGCSYHTDSNQLQCETPYAGEWMDGIQYCYYRDGTPLSETPYVEGTRHGVQKRYYENGYLEYEITWDDGYKYYNGWYKKYYESTGNLSLATPYVDGEIHGIETTYYENGNMASERPYENGMLNQNGIATTYWENGNLHTETPYYDGNYHGTVTSFYEDGSPYYLKEYSNGIKNGQYLVYYDNHQLESEKHFVDGKEHGKSVTYNRDGTISTCTIYDMGSPVENCDE